MHSRRIGYRIAVPTVLSWLVAMPALAADVPCAVGTQVEGEMGTGAVAEIGTQPPHVGWVRITHSWSPKGEWYDWRIWDVHPSGTKDRCVAPGATGPQPAGEPASFGMPVRDDDDPPAAAQAPAASTPRTTSTDRCPAGRAVVDRQQRAGNVLGEANGMCVVRLADGTTRSYLDWMLAAPGEADAGTGGSGLELGDYSCSLGAAGTFPITIGNGSYRDRAGKSGAWSYDAAGGAITFSSGSLQGTYSKKLGPGKFGLSSAPTKQFYAVCNRK
jgi:hypothetical protein